jgi:hypothetical protein
MIMTEKRLSAAFVWVSHNSRPAFIVFSDAFVYINNGRPVQVCSL